MTGHTLRINDGGPQNGVLSECSCGTSLGFITDELITTCGLDFYRKHQAQAVYDWLRHRYPYMPKPWWPQECTIRLVGGPRDGQEVTIPHHIYRGGYLETEKVLYRRDHGNPLLWKA